MKKYFLHDGTNHLGPFSAEELKSQEISKEDLVWFEGATGWQKAGEIEDIQHFFIAIPPPLQTYYIPQKQVKFTKPALFNANIKNIKNDPEAISDVTTLLLAVDEHYATIFLIHTTNSFLSSFTSIKEDHIKEIKEKRNDEIKAITKNLAKYLDEIIAYLCISNQRDRAISFYSSISNESKEQSSIYIDKLIAKYNLDMSLENVDIELAEKRERNKEKIEVSKKENERFRTSNAIGFMGFIGFLIIMYMYNEAKKAGITDEMKEYNNPLLICLVMIAYSFLYPLYVKHLQ